MHYPYAHNSRAPVLWAMNVVWVKFLNSLHFFCIFLYILRYIVNIPDTMLLILSNFVWPLLHSVYHHVTLFITHLLCIYEGIIWSPLQIPPCSIVNLCLISFWGLSALEQFPYMFFFLIIFDVILLRSGSCLVSTAILSKDKTSVSLPNVKMYFQILLFYLLTPCKIAILIVHLRVELNLLWHVLYQSQMPLILLGK